MKDKEIILDLNHLASENKLNVMTIFSLYGSVFKMILKHVLGIKSPAMEFRAKIKGTPYQINSFANTIHKEKKYINAIKKYGLDDPNTLNSNSKLDKAISLFQKETGIKWPFR